jgi:hypothetical protein
MASFMKDKVDWKKSRILLALGLALAEVIGIWALHLGSKVVSIHSIIFIIDC